MDDLVQRQGLYFKKFTDTPFSGEIKEGMSQGKIKDGRRVGKWAFFRDSGQLESKGGYENGKKEGEWLKFYNNGELFLRVNYKNGNVAGKLIAYDYDGNVSREENYQNDERDGTTILYVSGFKANEINYKLGEIHGPFIEYYLKNGKIESEAFYESGKLNGPFIEYFENGADIKAKGSYKDGKRHGVWEFFDTPGKKRFSALSEEDQFSRELKRTYRYPGTEIGTDLSAKDEGSGVYKDGKKVSP